MQKLGGNSDLLYGKKGGVYDGGDVSILNPGCRKHWAEPTELPAVVDNVPPSP